MAIINHNSISGINTISVGSSIVIGNNFVLDTKGIEGVQQLNVTGVVTASSFVGDGSTLTGIDATALKDIDGNVIVQAEASGINVTGVSTFSGNVNLRGTSFVGDSGSGTGAYWKFVSNQISNYYIAGADLRAISELRIGHSSNYQRTATFDITNKRLGINTESVSHTLYVNGDSYTDGNATFASDLDVDGHTELDNVNISGVLTATSAEFSGDVTVLGDLTYENVTNLDSVGVATARSGLRITGGGLDVVGVSTFQDDVYLGDNDIAYFGADNDLEIQHTGSLNVIRTATNATGDLAIEARNGTDLYLTAADDIFIRPQGGENGINVIGNGAVELYYDNSIKLATTSAGISVTGTVVSDGLSLGQTEYLTLGNSNELKVYYDGSQSYICANDLRIVNNAVNETLASFIANGAASLFYDDSKKLETTSTGVQVSNGYIYASNWGSLGNFSGQFGQIRVGADVYGNTIKVVNDTNMNITANSGIYFNTGAATDGSTAGTNRCLVDNSGHFKPASDNTYNLGTASNRWANVYSADLQLSNEGSANDVDGTWGQYTIQEGEHDLFLINRRSGKKYAFVLREVD